MTVSKIVVKSVCYGGAQVKCKNKYYSTHLYSSKTQKPDDAPSQ